ncbi:MAG: 16S rRNA (guanine(966)-N(2))-methyltransferase RsmD [Clostridia bacterium]|nr:16S rRNA (guanine(966)-N(2))-methyltransferase RsmD [Clostridia bacterium]
MRVITGRARGAKLNAPKGERTRPTSERAKEAVFSMLQFDIADRYVLDLFAGSGQMGIEALSRGARGAVFCDVSKDAVAVVRENLKKTRLEEISEVYSMDALALLRSLSAKKRFGLVFLDPPYAAGLLPKVLSLLLEFDLLEDGAKIVCESAATEDVFAGDGALASHFTLQKEVHYGIACVTVLGFCKGGET